MYTCVHICDIYIYQKESEVGGIMLPNFKTYYKAETIKLCGIGIRIGIEINGLELRLQKLALAFMVN